MTFYDQRMSEWESPCRLWNWMAECFFFFFTFLCSFRVYVLIEGSYFILCSCNNWHWFFCCWISTCSFLLVCFDNFFVQFGFLTLMMTSAQVVETLVTVTDNSPFQDYPHPDDHTTRSTVTPGFKPFTVLVWILLLASLCWLYAI